MVNEELFREMNDLIYEKMQINTHKLVTELETGGNIRFEEGKLGHDKWFSSCVDLLRTRFTHPYMTKYGILDINVTK
jgi:uncharacterized phage-like protein YoqJ